MEPTTRERTTWKHWAVALALPFFITIAAPAIASLPLHIAYAIAGVIAAILIGVTLVLSLPRR